jgi:anti-sigma B factor antagonist
MDIARSGSGLVLHGELDAAAAPELEVALREALLETTGTFVLDLSALEFMDSGGINALLQARALLAREERALTVVCPPSASSTAVNACGCGFRCCRSLV